MEEIGSDGPWPVPSSRVKAVLFDLGGVLLKPVPPEQDHWTYDHLAELSKRNIKEVEAIVSPLMDPMFKGKISPEEFNRTVANQLGISPDDIGWLAYCRMTEVPEGAVINIARVLYDQGITVAYFTNMDQADLRQLLPRLQVPFSTGVASYELGEYKLDSEIGIHAALSKLGRSKDEVLYIDDSKKNVDKAKALGIDAIHFQSPQQLVTELAARGIHFSTVKSQEKSKRA